MKIRLTESKLKQIVAESVKKVLKENGGYLDTYDEDTLDVQEEVKDLFSRILRAIGANVNKELLNQKNGRFTIPLPPYGFNIPVEWELYFGNFDGGPSVCLMFDLTHFNDKKRAYIEDYVHSIPSYIEQNIGVQTEMEEKDNSLELLINLFL
jgi:hypothetical protein